VLLLGGCGALAFLAVSSISGAVGPAKDAVEEYSTALVEQRWDDAHDVLCDESAARMAADDLEVLFGEPTLTGYRLDSVHVRSYSGRTTGDAMLTFEYEGGMEQSVAPPLVEDGDVWRPCPRAARPVREAGVEPARPKAPDPKSGVAAVTPLPRGPGV
jgi:hypothetical protein